MSFNFIKKNSFVTRFFIASLLIMPIFIVTSGAALLTNFKHSQINAEQEKLQAQIYLLLSITELVKSQPSLPNLLAEPRLNQQGSGLYAWIFNKENQQLWQSPSSLLIHKNALLKAHSFSVNKKLFTPTPLISPLRKEEQSLNQLSYDIEWIDDKGQSQYLRFIVASDGNSLIAEITKFQEKIWQGLGIMGLLFIFVQIIIMRWGLKPLTTLQIQLEQLRKHQHTHLTGNYPIEIQPIVDNFNHVLDQEQQRRERYRQTMADLAHSLKTPLAVIQSQISIDHQQLAISSRNDMQEQIQRIDQIIQHQLQRATYSSGEKNLIRIDAISVKATIEKICRTLHKVYPEKPIQFISHCEEDALFYGEEADLLEVLGNVLDNACKYGGDQIMIHVENRKVNKKSSERESDENEARLSICISDNGNGVPDTLKQTILKRGERADTAIQEGQGLGLSVVADIISQYHGQIEIHNQHVAPHLSGACFCISFYE